MSRFYAYTVVKIMLVTSHRDVIAAFKARRLFLAINFEILCHFYKEKCENNAFENSDTFDDWFCDFLFDGCFVKWFQHVSSVIIRF